MIDHNFLQVLHELQQLYFVAVNRACGRALRMCHVAKCRFHSRVRKGNFT